MMPVAVSCVSLSHSATRLASRAPVYTRGMCWAYRTRAGAWEIVLNHSDVLASKPIICTIKLRTKNFLFSKYAPFLIQGKVEVERC